MDLAKLDYWVSYAEQMRASPDSLGFPLVVRNYSSDAKLAHAIMVREHIVISHIVDDERGDMSIAWIDPSGDVERGPSGAGIWMGDTDYEAAMLCYVSACFGDAWPIDIESPATDSDQPLN